MARARRRGRREAGRLGGGRCVSGGERIGRKRREIVEIHTFVVPKVHFADIFAGARSGLHLDDCDASCSMGKQRRDAGEGLDDVVVGLG